jgi:hypothetical protein
MYYLVDTYINLSVHILYLDYTVIGGQKIAIYC